MGKSLSIKAHPSDSFKIRRKKINVPLLLERGVLRITYAGNGKGGVVKNNDPKSFAVVTSLNEKGKSGLKIKEWPDKVVSYKEAERIINSSRPNLGSEGLIGDEKYLQILRSARNAGIKDKDIFL